MRLPAPAIEALLDAWPLARLATTGRDGAPHAVPVVFAREGGRLWSPVDGKPKRGGELRRVANARAHPRVCLLLDAYDADWSRLWWLRVDGSARVVRAPSEDAPEVAEAVSALRRKYPQYAALPVLRDPPTLLCIAPEGVASWCASPEAVPRVGPGGLC